MLQRSMSTKLLPSQHMAIRQQSCGDRKDTKIVRQVTSITPLQTSLVYLVSQGSHFVKLVTSSL